MPKVHFHAPPVLMSTDEPQIGPIFWPQQVPSAVALKVRMPIVGESIAPTASVTPTRFASHSPPGHFFRASAFVAR